MPARLKNQDTGRHRNIHRIYFALHGDDYVLRAVAAPYFGKAVRFGAQDYGGGRGVILFLILLCILKDGGVNSYISFL